VVPVPEVQLSAGRIHYEDSHGVGPALVLAHGLLMDASMWDPVLAELGGGYRVVRPVLPLGAHPYPMRAEADLTMSGIASLLGELLERLDLQDVTLGVSDWGGPIVFLADGPPEQVRPRGISEQMLSGWLEAARADRGVRRDVARYARSGRRARPVLRAATDALSRFAGPSLIVWASEDRVMPPAHAHRMAALLRDSRLV
jgi:pimeloyl-ACP methyl ester carboxylesterase